MLRGSIVALITPMHDSGDIDWPALQRLVEWHLQHGTHGIVPMGTTGESATLNVQEHLSVIQRTIEWVAGKIPVIAGTGANATAEAIELTRRAKDLGADACLLVTPYYNRPTQEGLYRHYTNVAESVDIPQILYNVPARTGCDLLPETILRLASMPNIVAVKEASGEVARVSTILQSCPEDFVVLSGEDAKTFEMMKLGASGTISVTANVLPAEMAQFCQYMLEAEIALAEKLDAALQKMHEILFIESSPSPTKWALHEMGMIETGIRLPLLPLSEKFRPELIKRLRAAGALQI